MLRTFAKTILLAGAALSLSLPASAHEPNWGGLYIGANVGWAGTSYESQLQGFPDKVGFEQDAVLAGVHIGLQHQIGRFVIGGEASYGGTGWSGYGDRIAGGTASCLGVTAGGTQLSCDGKLEHVLMLGARLGWTPSTQWLLYTTGGFANGGLHDRVIQTATGRVVGESDRRHNGWYIGGGVEYALTKNWILGLEYLHVDFDRQFHCDQILGCAAGESRNATAETDIVRARLSFKLGREDKHHEPMK